VREIESNKLFIGEPITLPTEFGNLLVRHILSGEQQGVVITGEALFIDPVPVRIQSSCLFSESFLSTDCDCGAQLHDSLKIIASGGLLIYLYEEGRGAGLRLKIEGIRMQQREGCNTAEAYKRLNLEPDLRSHDVAIEVIREMLGSDRGIELITNNPGKVNALQGAGIRVVKRRPLVCSHNDAVEKYLSEKTTVLGHKLDHD
jgi:GTP cyclohydrolase II